MRKKMCMLLLLLLLTACAQPVRPEEEAASVHIGAVESSGEKNMRASLVESAPRPPLESDIRGAYDRALRVYGWFDLAPLPTSEENVLLEGVRYHRVNMNSVQDLGDLRAYLRSVFSQELADRLLDGETSRLQYREIDGVLYVSGVSRARDPGTGAMLIEVEQLEETVYSVNVLVDLLGEDGKTVIGQESWSFPYALVGDRWVFTDFRLVY